MLSYTPTQPTGVPASRTACLCTLGTVGCGEIDALSIKRRPIKLYSPSRWSWSLLQLLCPCPTWQGPAQWQPNHLTLTQRLLGVVLSVRSANLFATGITIDIAIGFIFLIFFMRGGGWQAPKDEKKQKDKANGNVNGNANGKKISTTYT